MRTILFTGKGGVGKTTCAAATALAIAASGRRTALISTDPAHSLADALDADLGDELSEVAPNCFAGQLDSRTRLEASWGELRDYLRELLNRGGLEGVEAEELAVVPGLDEVFALADIKELATSGDWDALVVDCAPTAETIRLLSLPEVLAWYMDRLFPLGRRLNRTVGPLVARLAHLPPASDEVFGAAASFYDRLDGVREILLDPSCTVRVVLTPERVVLAEARRTYTYLSLFGYHVDAVIANRVLPPELLDPWFDRWRESQAEVLDGVRSDVAPIPVLTAPLATEEVVGAEALAAHAAQLYGESDPAGCMHRGEPLRFEHCAGPDGGGPAMSLHLPLVERGEIDLRRAEDDLVVTVGPYRRIVALPDSFRRREVVGARFDGDRLEVRFGGHGGR